MLVLWMLAVALADCPAEERDGLGHCPPPKPVAAKPKPKATSKPKPKPLPPLMIEIDWVRIPAAGFQMGSEDGQDDEKPVHGVQVGPFQMSRSEVTVGQYATCVRAGACSSEGVTEETFGDGSGCNWGQPGRESHPMNCVDWTQAQDFARWARGRLPSESEWEYAARGGESYTYAGSNDLEAVAWVASNTGMHTSAVCGKQRNGFGLCDMSGNVWEWVEDWHHDSYEGAPNDGGAWTSGGGTYRVSRGGGWGSTPSLARVAYRFSFTPSRRLDRLGFRLAR